ncbi:hypothetical protein DAPPUDRAFT_100249 [Daphnia pulex]|uniref:Uncharacterized protein n=1 Tax=Daphnia pulex TaxID=6669 RepID=E9G9V9_DAPPU|nr:hypothetical protein DAPPUDRAFT_100249 [Daphnia pulex]|eukprot:EFX83811.1 hypothetical protein DAPPUDRAFT_100249 [Daphnia pulex]
MLRVRLFAKRLNYGRDKHLYSNESARARIWQRFDQRLGQRNFLHGSFHRPIGSGNYSILPERQPIHGQPIKISSATTHWSWTSYLTTATQILISLEAMEFTLVIPVNTLEALELIPSHYPSTMDGRAYTIRTSPTSTEIGAFSRLVPGEVISARSSQFVSSPSSTANSSTFGQEPEALDILPPSRVTDLRVYVESTTQRVNFQWTTVGSATISTLAQPIYHHNDASAVWPAPSLSVYDVPPQCSLAAVSALSTGRPSSPASRWLSSHPRNGRLLCHSCQEAQGKGAEQQIRAAQIQLRPHDGQQRLVSGAGEQERLDHRLGFRRPEQGDSQPIQIGVRHHLRRTDRSGPLERLPTPAGARASPQSLRTERAFRSFHGAPSNDSAFISGSSHLNSGSAIYDGVIHPISRTSTTSRRPITGRTRSTTKARPQWIRTVATITQRSRQRRPTTSTRNPVRRRGVDLQRHKNSLFKYY